MQDVNRSARHSLFSIGSALLLAAGTAAQSLSPKPSAVQYVTVEPAASAQVVAPGGSVSLWLDVTPKPNIHVYAAGAKDVTPVALIVSPAAGIRPGKPKYPAAELLASPGADSPVPVYRKPFRIVQPIAISKTAKPGQALTIAAALNYESCDDRLCYPPSSIPVNWVVKVR